MKRIFKVYSGEELKENEYLLKMKFNGLDTTPIGFMTKLNKNGTIPISFNEWDDSEIFIIQETFRDGWKINRDNPLRIGKSQSWISLIHPLGFTVEVYISKFINMISNGICTIADSELQGKFKWEYSNLIKE